MTNNLLTTEEAAARLNMRASTLRSWKHRGYGPAVIKFPGEKGSVRYDERDIEEFEAQCRQIPSVRAFVREELDGSL